MRKNREMTYKRWKENLGNILTWLHHQPWVNKNKIGCFAISSGTTAALRLAQEDQRLSFIISVATCISTNIGMGDGGPCKQLVDHLESLCNWKAVQLFGIEFGIDFYLDTIGNAPIYKMQDIKCPVYFLQGGLHNLYRRSDARLGYELMRMHNLPSYYNEISTGDHCFDLEPEECAKKSMGWLYKIGIVQDGEWRY